MKRYAQPLLAMLVMIFSSLIWADDSSSNTQQSIPLPAVNVIKWDDGLFATYVAAKRCHKDDEAPLDIENLTRVDMAAFNKLRAQNPGVQTSEINMLQTNHRNQISTTVNGEIDRQGCNFPLIKEMTGNYIKFSQTKYAFPDPKQDAHSCDTAIEIGSLQNEQDLLRAFFPDAQLIKQTQIDCPKFPADKLEIKLSNGSHRNLFFNIKKMKENDLTPTYPQVSAS